MKQTQRLDKTIAAQATLSRSEVKLLIRKGLVQVNEAVVRSADFQVDWQQDKVTVEGIPLSLKANIYLMLNKPKGVVSATKDSRFPTVLNLVPPQLDRKGLFPAGRLDKDTTGFVVITDDGKFAHDILSPRKHISKTYHAQLDGNISQEIVKAFAAGVNVNNEYTTMPAILELLETKPEGDFVKVVLKEGMYHQIKRMFLSFGITVLELKRVKMGMLDLDPNLPEGICRELTAKELELITSKDD